MWLQRFTSYLLSHRWQTLALVFVGSFIPPFGMIGILIAALVTLRKSIVEGGILAIATSVPYIISFYFSDHYQVAAPIALWATLGAVTVNNASTWVFAVLLSRRSSWSQILQVTALFGGLVISIIHLFYPNIADWWALQLPSYFQQVLPGLWKNLVANDLQLETINATKQYATGFIIVGVLFNAILQLILARWWQAIVFHPRSLRKELQNIRLSRLAGILFVAGLVLAYMGNNVVLDMMPILYMLFGAAGLSLIHYLFHLMQPANTWFWLIILYLSIPVTIMLIALLALFDVWLDIRSRFRKLNLR